MASAATAADDTADYDRYSNEIARLYSAARYNEALPLAEQFSALAQRLSGSESAYYARAASWKATLYLTLGSHDKSAPLFEEALAIFEKSLKPDDPELARAISNLGISRQSAGQIADAEALFRKSLEIRERVLPPDHSDIAENLNNLADLYNKQDRLEEAEFLLRQGLSICEKGAAANSPLIAAILQNLAVTLELQGRDKEAEILLKRAIAVRKSSQPPLHPEIAGAVHHLAHNLHLQRQFKEAEVQFKAALRMREQSQPAGHFDIAKNLKDLAVLYIEEQKFSEALPLLQQVIAMTEKTYSTDHPLLIEPLELMAITSDRGGRSLEALKYARRATGIAVEREKLTRNNSVYFQAHVRLAWKVYDAGQRRDTALLEEALTVAQRAELTSTASSISNLAVRLAASDPRLRDIIRERQDLENAREATDRQFNAMFAIPQATRGDAALKVHAALDRIQSRLKEIDVQIKASFPKYSELLRPAPLTLNEIREVLRPEEALVNFLSDETEIFVWAITRERAAWERLDITRSDIEAYERKLRDALELEKLAPNSRLFDLTAANEIYRKLFGPVERVVGAKHQLIVVSSGALTSMPFQAFVLTPPRPAKEPPKNLFQAYREADWFVRHYALSVLPAVSNLKALRSEEKAHDGRRPLIGFANPKYGEQRIREAAARSLTRAYTSYWRGGSVNLDALRAGLAPLPSLKKNCGPSDVPWELWKRISSLVRKPVRQLSSRPGSRTTVSSISPRMVSLRERSMAWASRHWRSHCPKHQANSMMGS